ncbi:MAG: PAS domain-containing sensor histidine kinase [Ignavibacteria bacterium]
MIDDSFYKDIFDNSSEAILFTAPDGRIFSVNHAACMMFGMSEEEIIEGGREKIVDYTDPRLLPLIEKRKREGFVNGDLTFIRKDGTKFQGFLSSKIFRTKSGEERTSMLIKDMTKYKDVLNRLKESEEKYRNLFNRSQVAMARTTIDGSAILDVNEKYCDFTGYSKEDLIGKPAAYVWAHPEKRNEITAILSEKGVVTDHEAEIVFKNGRVVTILVSLVVFPEEYSIVSCIVDITKRKKMENALRKSEQELLISNTEKEKYFSILAHDLRSPISSFIGLTELMKADVGQFTIIELESIADKMNQSAKNLMSLLSNLLEWSMVKGGMVNFEPKNIDLWELVDSIAQEDVDLFKNKKIDFHNHIPKNTFVFADEDMLRIIIRNLITNSVKFSNEKSSVQIRGKELNDNSVEICVCDNGIGMSDNILNNLFKLDANVKREGTANEKSTGLGLMICKEFVEKHNGKIWAESEVGKGSKFYFTLNKKRS